MWICPVEPAEAFQRLKGRGLLPACVELGFSALRRRTQNKLFWSPSRQVEMERIAPFLQRFLVVTAPFYGPENALISPWCK